jgi:hypothetical protein
MSDVLFHSTDMLRKQAERCRRLAQYTLDAEVVRSLLELADEFDVRAVTAMDRVRQE